MSDLALDPATGDLALVDGAPFIARGDTAIAQDWALRMGTLAGTWFRDRGLGIDPAIVNGPMSRTREIQVRAEVRRETLAVRGLVGIRSITLSLDSKTRAMHVSVDAVKDAGEVVPLRILLGTGLTEELQ